MITNREKLETLQGLVIDALIEELKQGKTHNISVATTLLTANKVVTLPTTEDSMHNKILKAKKVNQ